LDAGKEKAPNKNMRKLLKASAAVLLAASSATCALAQSTVVYQSDIYLYNNGGYTTTWAPSGTQIGDEVILSGSSRWVTGFSFDYWAQGLPADATGQVTFYDTTGGTLSSSSSILWQSSAFSLVNTADLGNAVGQVASWTQADLNGGFAATSDLAWVVKFTYSSGAVDLFYSGLTPTVGGNYADYWRNNGTGWQLYAAPTDSPESAGNYVATIWASVPEPTTFALFGIGGVAGMFLIRRRKLA